VLTPPARAPRPTFRRAVEIACRAAPTHPRGRQLFRTTSAWEHCKRIARVNALSTSPRRKLRAPSIECSLRSIDHAQARSSGGGVGTAATGRRWCRRWWCPWVEAESRSSTGPTEPDSASTQARASKFCSCAAPGNSTTGDCSVAEELPPQTDDYVRRLAGGGFMAHQHTRHATGSRRHVRRCWKTRPTRDEVHTLRKVGC